MVALAHARRGSARFVAAVATVAGLLVASAGAMPAAAQVVSNERVPEMVQDFDECNALSIDWTWVTHTVVREDGYLVTIIGRGVGEDGGRYVIADVFTPQHFFIRQIRQGSGLPNDDWFTNDVTGSFCR